MAIFVLLFILLLTQVRSGGPTQEEMEAVQQELEQAKADSAELEKQISQQVSARNVTLVIALDGTGSMKDSFDILKSQLTRMCLEVSEIIQEFQIGIVIYRENLEVFPITRIQADTTDGGVSRNKLQGFIQSANHRGSPAATGQGIQTALSMIQQNGQDEERAYVFALIGDVGPGEVKQELRREAQYIRLVDDFRNQYSSRVVTVYTGTDYNGDNELFFKEIAKAGGDVSMHSRDGGSLIGNILLAVLKSN